MPCRRQVWAVLALLALPASAYGANCVSSSEILPCEIRFDEIVYCEEKKLEDLTIFKDKYCENVRSLLLRGNDITELSDGDFSAFPHATAIDLQNNRVRTVGEDVFSDMTELRTLHLDQNILTDLTSLKLPQVTKLYLKGNTLNQISGGPTAEELEDLVLAECQLSGFTVAILQNTPNLKTLDLSGNNLPEIKSEWFENTADLTNLDISNNKVKSVDLSGGHLGNLQVLDLSYNSDLEALAISEFALPQLHTLRLDHTSLRVPEEVLLLSHGAITELSLKSSITQSTTLPTGALSELPRLQRLDLSENRLMYVEGLASESLEELYLSENFLLVLSDDAFAGTPRLRELHLDGNVGLQTISLSAIERLNDLQVLDVSGTQVVCLCSENYRSLKRWADAKEVDFRAVCGTNPPCDWEEDDASSTTEPAEDACRDTLCDEGLGCCPNGACTETCGAATLPAAFYAALGVALVLLLAAALVPCVVYSRTLCKRKTTRVQASQRPRTLVEGERDLHRASNVLNHDFSSC